MAIQNRAMCVLAVTVILQKQPVALARSCVKKGKEYVEKSIHLTGY
jgi:hypothetical protein